MTMETNNLGLGFRQTGIMTTETGSYIGVVVHSDLRPPREDLVRRREAFDGNQHRSRDADVAHGKAARVSFDKETN